MMQKGLYLSIQLDHHDEKIWKNSAKSSKKLILGNETVVDSICKFTLFIQAEHFLL